MNSEPQPPRRPADLMATAMIRRLKLGPGRNKVTVDRGVHVPMRDGTVLLADHYAPVTDRPRATVLMRTPYGRGSQAAMMGRPYAERGYHVLIQSTRGTFGSGGQFTPGADEAADGQDTVAWLRRQDWFNGRLVTSGPSYLAFTAWALALDPPPELMAMAVYISPHDLAEAGFGQGPFELFNLLFWSDLMAYQERLGALRMIWRTMNADKRLQPALNRLPIAATGAALAAIGGAPWYADWLAHPDRGDPYWHGYNVAAALDRITVPTLLVSGFHDFFIDQTMRQYQTLRRRGVTVGLTVGPWGHMTLDMGVATRETLAWFDAFTTGNEVVTPPRRTVVRAWTSGLDRWRELPDWPLANTATVALYLRSGGRLAAPELAAADPDASRADGAGLAGAGLGGAGSPALADQATEFRYDPADPTPSVGGRLMSLRLGGSQDNAAVEARADVLTFTTGPLSQAVEVAGIPVVQLYVRSDNAYHDLFVRLCDVDTRGRSGNLTDQIIRSAPEQVTPGVIRRVDLAMTDVSHVFLPGHRIRLQISGGAHPRFARNLGTDADLVHGTAMAVVTHHVQHGEQHPSALILPVVDAAIQPAGVAAEAGRLAAQAGQHRANPAATPPG
jgi:uncharacterized protein